jgi:hypothetical protein
MKCYDSVIHDLYSVYFCFRVCIVPFVLALFSVYAQRSALDYIYLFSRFIFGLPLCLFRLHVCIALFTLALFSVCLALEYIYLFFILREGLVNIKLIIYKGTLRMIFQVLLGRCVR